jgi:hypothetical protein
VLICFRIFGDFDVAVLFFSHVLMDPMVNSMNIWLVYFLLGRGNPFWTHRKRKFKQNKNLG